MANKRITEQFFRNLIYKDKLYIDNKVIVDTQPSKNIKIDKLLKNASKSGNNKGYPEFIIQFKENYDFIIVVECKTNINFHASKNRNNYKNYAVDGVLLYSSFLSKEYDVLSIAISGEEEQNLKISHFLQLKNTNESYNVFNDNHFLTLNDYLNSYKNDERKFNQDFQKLLKYSKYLNDNLHLLKVPESDRSLLISGCLIALSDKAFLKIYKDQSPKELSENLINTIKNKLNNVDNKHIEDIATSYDFIKTHTILSKQENKLRDIIINVDEKINNFIKTYQYFDALGQFYIEFLRYANNDKGLGIVLTPPHITELFCEIANVNQNSIVLDTCTGTGGFLISAMKKMIVEAKGDSNKEKEIKQKQIIGVELQHRIFSLTCSNMYIHGDGRSNLIKGDCFDQKIKKQIDEYKPNTGFLNPPYKTNKNDKHELKFILNNLSYLQKGAYCVAIVPMSCAIESDTTTIELKHKLLENHTLEAVFSMPNELFYNSNVNVSTCIMVFKAYEKHEKSNYKTYFAYWKNDGFIKIKNIGRIDYNNQWSTIKTKWLENYKNKEEKIGNSIKYKINHSDEWCAEAYIDIDYSNIKKINFENFIRDYSGNLFLMKKIDIIKKRSLNNKNIELSDRKYKYFNLIDIFNIKKGERLNKNKRIDGITPLLTSTSLNNGITTCISKEEFHNEKKIFSNKITIDMLSNVFFHGYEYFSDDNIHTFILKNRYSSYENNYIYIFIAILLRKLKIKYNYGRQVRLKRLERERIRLPIGNNKNIDWQFMKNYIQSLPYSSNLENN